MILRFFLILLLLILLLLLLLLLLFGWRGWWRGWHSFWFGFCLRLWRSYIRTNNITVRMRRWRWWWCISWLLLWDFYIVLWFIEGIFNWNFRLFDRFYVCWSFLLFSGNLFRFFLSFIHHRQTNNRIWVIPILSQLLSILY